MAFPPATPLVPGLFSSLQQRGEEERRRREERSRVPSEIRTLSPPEVQGPAGPIRVMDQRLGRLLDMARQIDAGAEIPPETLRPVVDDSLALLDQIRAMPTSFDPNQLTGFQRWVHGVRNALNPTLQLEIDTALQRQKVSMFTSVVNSLQGVLQETRLREGGLAQDLIRAQFGQEVKMFMADRDRERRQARLDDQLNRGVITREEHTDLSRALMDLPTQQDMLKQDLEMADLLRKNVLFATPETLERRGVDPGIVSNFRRMQRETRAELSAERQEKLFQRKSDLLDGELDLAKLYMKSSEEVFFARKERDGELFDEVVTLPRLSIKEALDMARQDLMVEFRESYERLGLLAPEETPVGDVTLEQFRESLTPEMRKALEATRQSAIEKIKQGVPESPVGVGEADIAPGTLRPARIIGAEGSE
jgi:hypothetical protein